MYKFSAQEKKKRIELLYLIYRESEANSNFPISLGNIRRGTDRLMGKAPNYLSSAAMYLIGDDWISQRSDYEDIVFITHPGIKEAEELEENYRLDQRIELDLMYEETRDETKKSVAEYLGANPEDLNIGRPRFLINWDDVASTELEKKTNTLKLFRLMDNHFNMGEFKEICFKLEDVDFDNLSGQIKREKIRELIESLERRDDLGILIKILKESRPKIDWEGTNS